jgi:hypothetical protein
MVTHLRLHENSKLFKTFINYCLVHFVGSLTWRWQAYYRYLSDNEDGCDDDEDTIDEFIGMEMIQRSQQNQVIVVGIVPQVPMKAID